MSLWSDKPTFITPSMEIISGRLANMWAINDVLLQVIRVIADTRVLFLYILYDVDFDTSLY